VVFIEVQHGTYFGEDDIVRLEDDSDGELDRCASTSCWPAGTTDVVRVLPAQSDEETATLEMTLGDLEQLRPSFVSVTYRGGRASRQRTFDLVTKIQHDGHLTAMAHLICVGHSRDEIRDILEALRRRGRRQT